MKQSVALGKRVLGGLSAFAVIFNVACSLSAAGTGNGAGEASPDSGAIVGPASDAGGPGRDSGEDAGNAAGDAAGDAPGTNPDDMCATLIANACADCCANNHPSGANVADNCFYTCICDPFTCQAECAQTDCSWSADAGYPEAGDPCDLCEQQAAPDDGGGTCGPQITAACNASADCMAFFACEGNCP